EAPYTEVLAGRPVLDDAALQELARELAAARRGIIVAGPDTPTDAALPIMDLAERLGWPVLADPLSGLRTTPVAHAGLVVDAYDVFLRDQQVVAALAPDLVLRFGALPVSKPLLLFLDRYAERPQAVVDPGARWRDPVLAASRMVYADPGMLCCSLLEAVDGPAPGRTPGPASDWLELWRRLNRRTREGLRERVERLDEPF